MFVLYQVNRQSATHNISVVNLMHSRNGWPSLTPFRMLLLQLAHSLPFSNSIFSRFGALNLHCSRLLYRLHGYQMDRHIQFVIFYALCLVKTLVIMALLNLLSFVALSKFSPFAISRSRFSANQLNLLGKLIAASRYSLPSVCPGSVNFSKPFFFWFYV